MEISNKNIFVYLWKFACGESYNSYSENPNNICSLFWGALFGLIMLLFTPLMWLTIPFKKLLYLEIPALWIFWVHWIIITVCFNLGNNYDPNLSILYSLIVGFLIVICICVIAGLIIFGISKLPKIKKSETVSIFSNSMSAIKNRYCIKITYK